MRVFIIGGAGYIGSHMVKVAHNAGHEVITIDNLSTGHKDAILYGQFEFCDVLDTSRLNEIFIKYRPDAVMHFCAYSIVSESVKDPYKYYHNNVSGTLSLLSSMVENNCKKLIFSSTAAIFGNPEYLPIDESHVKVPINPYGKSKLMVEEILKDFEVAYGLKYVSFRYFNAAGHDPDGLLKERHDPETHLLPIVMQAANKTRDFVSIFGMDYETRDGTCIRDYIHVNDIATAHLKGLEYLNNNDIKSIELNLGNGNGFSVEEVVQEVENFTGEKINIIYEDRRLGDPPALIANGDYAKDILKLNNKYCSLRDIIKTL
ncbi:UDP-glucose 4-epimerase GalE [Gammaproteobacteria bacterium]|nr:UDP-glucose 4-epimerase GalE [Gammaproteobacteria bacterium]